MTHTQPSPSLSSPRRQHCGWSLGARRQPNSGRNDAGVEKATSHMRGDHLEATETGLVPDRDLHPSPGSHRIAGHPFDSWGCLQLGKAERAHTDRQHHHRETMVENGLTGHREDSAAYESLP